MKAAAPQPLFLLVLAPQGRGWPVYGVPVARVLFSRDVAGLFLDRRLRPGFGGKQRWREGWGSAV